MIDYDATVVRIIDEIESHGYTRNSFSEKFGIMDARAFSKWKQKKYSPSLDKVVRIADALGVKVDDLIVRVKE